MYHLAGKTIILSRTDHIGDVTLSLPLASALKRLAPSCKIIYLAQEYTRAVVEQYADVDGFLDWNTLNQAPDGGLSQLQAVNADIFVHLRPKKAIAKLAAKAQIPYRVGSIHRPYHWFTCNKLLNVLRTSKTTLHGSQIELQYLQAFTGQKEKPATFDSIANLLHFKPFTKPLAALELLEPDKFNLILHPKCLSQAGKREWPETYFAKLITTLPQSKFKIFISGTENEGAAMRKTLCEPYAHVTDLSGKLSLAEFIQFIAASDGLIAGSTGPLHLAGALGIHALGFYTPAISHAPSRWRPIGPKAEFLVTKEPCEVCQRRHDDGMACQCIQTLTPECVVPILKRWEEEKCDACVA